MKKVIQLILFSFLIIISIIFYKIYFVEKEQPKVEIDIQEEQQVPNTENNLIKNLKYEVKLDQDNQYIITSDLSEITYENNFEVVKMQNVTAIFIDQSNIPTDIEVMINDGEIAMILLRLVEIIGEDDLKDLCSETLYFIISTLNKLNIDKIRNDIILQVIPVKV